MRDRLRRRNTRYKIYSWEAHPWVEAHPWLYAAILGVLTTVATIVAYGFLGPLLLGIQRQVELGVVGGFIFGIAAFLSEGLRLRKALQQRDRERASHEPRQ